MMASTLYQMVNLKPQNPYVINTFIYEYDLSKANINVLRTANIIDDLQYQYLCNSDRMFRQVTVGNMIKENKEIVKILKHGIIDAKRLLFESNNIEDWEVLGIKNDAVFITGRELYQTEFGSFYKFMKNNVYTIFLGLQNLEIYYYDQFINGNLSMTIDVKGINDNLLPLHQYGMIDIICTVCDKLQRGTISETLSYISYIYEEYVNRRLPLDCYRDFDYKSKYNIISKYSVYSLNQIFPEHLSYIDINRNLLIIRDLMYIVSSVYSNQKGGRG